MHVHAAAEHACSRCVALSDVLHVCGLMCVATTYRLDVDKLDYLKRDNSACGELTTSEFSSLYENMKVGAQLTQTVRGQQGERNTELSVSLVGCRQSLPPVGGLISVLCVGRAC